MQIGGTMVRLPDQRSADGLPKHLSPQSAISRITFRWPRGGYFQHPRGAKTVRGINGARACAELTRVTRPYEAPRNRGSPRYGLCARC